MIKYILEGTTALTACALITIIRRDLYWYIATGVTMYLMPIVQTTTYTTPNFTRGFTWVHLAISALAIEPY
jgi:hypothetical protein